MTVDFGSGLTHKNVERPISSATLSFIPFDASQKYYLNRPTTTAGGHVPVHKAQGQSFGALRHFLSRAEIVAA